MNIVFDYVSTHKVKYQNGYVSISPALTTSSRLYVIWNGSTDRPIYVGTADDVQDRFDSREKAMRDMGFSEAQMNPIFIMVVRISIGGHAAPPGNLGISRSMNGIDVDVEHLLLRTYMICGGQAVRNSAKTAFDFTNNTGERINWELENSAGIEGFSSLFNGGRTSWYLNNGDSF